MAPNPKMAIELAREPQTIQSLARGLSLLIALNENAPASLGRLVDVTGLPKATAVRILHTLRALGFVEAAAEGYRALPRVRLLSSSLDRDGAATQFVQRLLNDFAQLVKWPAEFLVRDGATMVIEVSNRNVAPIGLKRFEYTRFPLFGSAAGLALLAWSNAQSREKLIRTVGTHLKPAARAEALRLVRGKIEETRSRGYAMYDYEAPIEGTRAISVPVLWQEAPIGALSLIFLRDAVPPRQMETTLLPRLCNTANEIGAHYVRLGG